MNKLFLFLAFVGCSAGQVVSQSFTKITAGAIVNDGGASRSVNWIDYDNDGYLDLFVSNGLEGGERNFLYKNNRDGSFTKIISGPIVEHAQPYDGASWADTDGDGDVDCFVVNWYDSSNVFFLNNGGGVFARTNIGASQTDRGYSETCSWGDYDNDGRLDLYVSNSGSSSLGAKRNFLYHNTASGFVKIDTGAIVTDQFFSRGVSWIDYDNDGDQDMFVVSERNQANTLYKNRLKETGAASFERIVSGAIATDVASSVSSSWADFDNDGDQDVFVANGWPFGQNDFLYLNNGNGTFGKVTSGDAVNDAAFSESSAWGDFDNDGDLDLFVTTAFASAGTKNFLYKNQLMENGTASLQKITAGDIVNDVGYSFGCAWGDYDRDGDLDLFVAKTFNENENNALYRNDNANGNHWILINCTGSGLNKSGIGAKVRVKATINGNTVWQTRIVEGQSGYCGQNLQLHFGLGNATSIDSMKIEWPSGNVESFLNVIADRIVTAIEGGGITSVGQQHHAFPDVFELQQNYPNPFNPTTTIVFSVGTVDPVAFAGSNTSLRVFDVLGKEIATLVNERKNAGEHSLVFDAGHLASGVYLYELRSGDLSLTKKMILAR